MFPTSINRRLVLALFALLPALPALSLAAEQPAASHRVEAEMLDGTPFSLAGRDGITLVSVWSPESLASRKCIWELQRFAAAYASRGVYTLAASVPIDRNALREFVAKRQLDLPIAILGQHDLGPLDETRLPLVYVFDRQGQLRAAHAGLYAMRVLERLVAPLLEPQ
ncbi:MAG: TlpA disulfide reductase family protein [Bacillota bacterium]